MAYVVMAYAVMAYAVMVYAVTAYVVTAHIVMAYAAMAYSVMAYVVMACIVMAYKTIRRGQNSWQVVVRKFQMLRPDLNKHSDRALVLSELIKSIEKAQFGDNAKLSQELWPMYLWPI